jgi:hypothetical protein
LQKNMPGAPHAMKRSRRLFDDSWRDSGRFAEQFPETTVFMRFPWMREYCKKGQKGNFSPFSAS